MIKIYALQDGYLTERQSIEGIIKFEETVWIDIKEPTEEEETIMLKNFNITLPNIIEIDDIEVSRRLHSEDGIHYLTAYMLSSEEAGYFQSNSVRFILIKSILITVRYVEIDLFNQVQNIFLPYNPESGHQVLLALLKSSIYHFADVLEQIGFNIELQTKSILNTKSDANIKDDFRAILQHVSRSGDSTSKAREGLISINRLITYITQEQTFSIAIKSQISIMAKDISALNDHTFFLSNQINFLLDATLGMINIEQNVAIKVFSIASTMLLPPTLIAGIYGMNFIHHIPGSEWRYGFLFALFLMAVSSYLPYKYFKKRGWF